MAKQLIVSIGREYGSGGHRIGEIIAEKLQLPLYDRSLLREIAGIKKVDAENLEKYDEIPRNRLFSRTVRGYNNSPEENIARMQFDYLHELAEKGESFVIIGRCAESVLSEYDALIPIFVVADIDYRIATVMERDGINESTAEIRVKRVDHHRKEYHNYYCSGKWGDCRNYGITINSGRLGEEGTAEYLTDYLKKRAQIEE